MPTSKACASIAAAAHKSARRSPDVWTSKAAAAMKAMITRVWAIKPRIHNVIHSTGRTYQPFEFRDIATIFLDLDPAVSDEDHLRSLQPAAQRLCGETSEVRLDDVLCTLDCVFHTHSWLFVASIDREDADAVGYRVITFWIGQHDVALVEALLKDLQRGRTLEDFVEAAETLAMSRQVAIVSRGETTRLAPFIVESERVRLQLLSFVTGIQRPRATGRLASDVDVIEGEDPFPAASASSRAWMVKWFTPLSGTHARTTVLPAFLSADGLQGFADSMADVFRDADGRPDTADLVRYLIQNRIHQASVPHGWVSQATNWLRQNPERLAQFTTAVARLVYPGQNVSHWNQGSPGIVRCGHGDQWRQVAVTLYDYAVTVRPSARPGSAFLDVGDAEDAVNETRVARSHRRVFDRRALEAAMRGLMDAVDAGGY